MHPQRIALVRHGETDWNARNWFQGRTDRPLNDTGGAQALRAANGLASLEWDRIVTSPLLRARQTAAIIADQLKVPLEDAEWDDLTERGFGVAEGTDRDEALRRWPDMNFPGAEPQGAVDDRSQRALSLLSETPGATIVVTHVVIVRAITLAATGTDPGMVANASSTVLERAGGHWFLRPTRD